jgi:outer membrane protein assembly factor BamE (lipoprotein component of BamABCDE complex)
MNLLRNATIAIALSTTLLSGCQTGEVLNQGYVVDEQTLALAPVGSSREQVLLSLGTPSTTATFDNEVFYYISQKRARPVAFMKPKIIDQSVWPSISTRTAMSTGWPTIRPRTGCRST